MPVLYLTELTREDDLCHVRSCYVCKKVHSVHAGCKKSHAGSPYKSGGHVAAGIFQFASTRKAYKFCLFFLIRLINGFSTSFQQTLIMPGGRGRAEGGKKIILAPEKAKLWQKFNHQCLVVKGKEVKCLQVQMRI